MSAEVGCQVIDMVVVSIPNEYIPQLMMAVEAKKGDGDAWRLRDIADTWNICRSLRNLI